MRYSVAIGGDVAAAAEEHLLQHDAEEDLCFALWYPSHGRERFSGLIAEVVLLLEGGADRLVHGNAEFLPPYFERALALAISRDAGLAFMHSHLGVGWQGMSDVDVRAERGIAAAVLAATGLPLLGMTIGRDASWSGRFWHRTGARSYHRVWCQSVRVAADELRVTFNDRLLPKPKVGPQQARTVSAWGTEVQANLARLRIGLVGLGSVGSVVAEELARIGIADVVLIDFDSIEEVNLDRVLHATTRDAHQRAAKVEVAAGAMREGATAKPFRVAAVDASICEELGYRAALDCDLIFSCVDRPWPRNVLDFIAYGHLIPVIETGIHVSLTREGRMRGADWKVQIAGPGRECMECSGQYSPGLVAAEQKGLLDDPRYIQGLPLDHPLRRNENVFAFSVNAASFGVLQMLSMVVAPLDYPDPGSLTYHFVPGIADREHRVCRENCFTPRFEAHGDLSPFVTIVGTHEPAERARRSRRIPLWRRILAVIRS